MKKIENNIQNGSITLFVLITVIFILIILSIAYITTQRNVSNIEREVKQIEKNYKVNNNDLTEEYNKIVE